MDKHTQTSLIAVAHHFVLVCPCTAVLSSNVTINNKTNMNLEQVATLSPISKLPVEVFGRVLQHHLSEVSSFQRTIDNRNIVRAYYKRLRDLSLVCRRWAIFVQGSPSLWTIISAQMPHDLLQICLVKSGRHLIDLECSSMEKVPEHSPECSGEDLRSFWDAVRPHFSRCRTAYIQCHVDDLEYSVDVLEMTSSRLSSLALNATTRFGESSPPLKLFGGQVTTLKSLELTSVSLDWLATSLRGLTSLSLKSIVAAPSAAALANIIKCSPDLESLSLKSMYWDSEPLDTNGSWSPIDLLQLRTLILDDTSLAQMEAVLMSIKSIPRCTKFDLALNVWEDDHHFSMNDSLRHLIPDVQRMLQIDRCEDVSGPPLCLKIVPGDRGSMCFPEDHISNAFRLNIDAPDAMRADAIRFAAALIEGTGAQVSMLIESNNEAMVLPGIDADLELLQAAQQLPVTHLHLHNLLGWDVWLRYLSSFYSQDEQSFAQSFKGLTQLTCSEDFNGYDRLYEHEDDIFAMVTRRYSDRYYEDIQYLVGRGLEYIPPLPLEKFVYDGTVPMPTITLEMLEDILGPGVFEDRARSFPDDEEGALDDEEDG